MTDTAAPNDRTTVSPAAPAAIHGAVWTLRLLLIGMIAIPPLLGAIGGYLSYRADNARATAALAEAVVVAEENTTKVLDTHMLVAARIADLLGDLPDNDIRAQEQLLHQRIAQQIAGLPQVAAAWVIDAAGHELVSARVFPVNRELDHSGRDDFRALRNASAETFIWALRARSLNRGDYQPYFTVSRRRTGTDGSFRGIVVVSVSGQYFASFYNSLLGGSAQYTASILREDGVLLARYPDTEPSASAQQHDRLLAEAIADHGKGGIIATGSPFDADGRVVAFKRLANYPVYVAIGRTRASILGEWLQSVLGYAAIGVPAAVGLMLLSLLALRRTRREQLALAQARDAVAQRAALEAQLNQAQRMEAVGLLTAGIAHDFNNLLTIVSGNIALLTRDLGSSDLRRQRLIEAANTACQRAAALTARLLGFARREPVNPRPLDVNEVVHGVAELPWRSLGDQVVIELRLSENLWPVFVDPHQLENAILNLALNARDAMNGTGCLCIETANLHLDDALATAHPGVPPGDYVSIQVSDNGCGMSQAVAEKAFDPFFTTKGAGKGTGLGLFQVYGFITRSGGYCAIDSEPGRGTAIKLYLPRYTEANETASDQQRTGSAESAAGAPAA